MNLNPNFDAESVPITGLKKPIIDISLPRESHLEHRFCAENDTKLVHKNSCVEAYSQTQLYFYQKYIVKAMESVDSGGYQGLVH